MKKKMKQWTAFLLSVVLLLGGMTACGKADKEISGEKPLTIAYGQDTVGNFPGLESVISGMEAEGVQVEVLKFPTEAEMATELSEELMAGKGPDVVLSTNYGALDYEGLAKDGCFYDLTTWAESEFSPDQHYTNILNGSQINGKQYAIPLSFSVPMLLTTEEKMRQANITLAGEYTGEEWMEQFLAGDPADGTTQYAVTWGSTGYEDLPLAAALDIPLTDGTTALPEEEAFVAMEKFAKLLDEQLAQQSKKGNTRKPMEVLAEETESMTFSIFLRNFNLLFAYWVNSGYQLGGDLSELRFFPVTTYDSTDNFALATTFGTVSAGAANPELGFQFLKRMATLSYDQNVANVGLTLNKKSVEYYLDELTTRKDTIRQGTAQVQGVPLSQGQASRLRTILEETDGCVITNLTESAVEVSKLTMKYRRNGEDLEELLPEIRETIEYYQN